MLILWDRCPFYVLKLIDRMLKSMSKRFIHIEIFGSNEYADHCRINRMGWFICVYDSVSYAINNRNHRDTYLSFNNICQFCHKKYKSNYYLKCNHKCKHRIILNK